MTWIWQVVAHATQHVRPALGLAVYPLIALPVTHQDILTQALEYALYAMDFVVAVLDCYKTNVYHVYTVPIWM